MGAGKVVICSLGNGWRRWELPASHHVGERWISGGLRTLHELAVAATVCGYDVELRGHVHEATLEQLARAAGVRTPLHDLEARPPADGEIVVVTEGLRSPHEYATVALSGARGVVFMLAAPGLFGWPFAPGWTLPDPLSVDVGSVARPEHFQSMSALGFDLWSNSRRLSEAARAVGVACEWVGTGRPGWPVRAAGRTHDVAIVLNNRWVSLAKEVTSNIEASVLPIGEVTNDEMIELLSRARMLVYPSRVEGHGRLQTEARLVGTVPIGLACNPFVDGLEEASGAVTVPTLEGMPRAIEALLRDETRLAGLSETASRAAAEEVDWERFVKRVGDLLANVSAGPVVKARAEFGRALSSDFRRAERLSSEVSRSRARVDQLEQANRTLGEELRARRRLYDDLRMRKGVQVALRSSRFIRRVFERLGART